MLLLSRCTAGLDQSCQLEMALAWTLFLTPGTKSQTPIPGWESKKRNGHLQAAALGWLSKHRLDSVLV